MPRSLHVDKKTARCQHFFTSASTDQCPLRAIPGGRVCRQHLAARDHPLRECLAVFDVNAAWEWSNNGKPA